MLLRSQFLQVTSDCWQRQHNKGGLGVGIGRMGSSCMHLQKCMLDEACIRHKLLCLSHETPTQVPEAENQGSLDPSLSILSGLQLK